MKKIVLLFIILISGVSFCWGESADSFNIKGYLDTLTKTRFTRSYDHPEQLMTTAKYIQNVFGRYSDSLFVQEFYVDGKAYRNVICSFGTENEKRIIIGAHYDVFNHYQGADDNASGVTAILELARMLKGIKLNYRIDLVAYCLEEPPHYGSSSMGSFVHAKYLFDTKTNVYGMISLEMIGYYTDEPHTQTYPVKVMSLLYGNRGNFITLVRKMGSGQFANRFCRKFVAAHTLRTVNFKGPRTLKGLDWSDHANYWDVGYSALMITDSSFYRNPNYHKATDTIGTLNIKKMAEVINGIYSALINL